MPKLVLGEELKEIIDSEICLEQGNVEDVEGIKYDFKFGNRFLKARFTVPKNYDELSTDDLKYAFVEPGEVVFVLSKEKLKLPNDLYIQLNPKRSLAHDGIQLLGGLTVDPGYEGYLVFGLYNVSGTSFKLRPGLKLVGANFYRLLENEIQKEAIKRPNSIYDFPERLQELIGKYEPVNPQTISNELKKLQSEFNLNQDKINENMMGITQTIQEMRKELSDEVSKRNQESIRVEKQLSNLERKVESINDNSIRHEQSLNNLNNGIKETKDDLKLEIRELKTDISSIDKTFSSIRVWAKIGAGVLAVVGGAIGGLATGVLQKLLGI